MQHVNQFSLRRHITLLPSLIGLILILMGSSSVHATGGTIWTSRTSAADNAWNSVTYGNGLFVAVASSGTGNRVMTSPDGITWTSRTSAADYTWNSITYGNGLFVAVGTNNTTYSGEVMTSPDGITWTSRNESAGNYWSAVTYGNGLFVTVGYSGIGNNVMTSPDGVTWTLQTTSTANGWSSVTYGNGLFVAVATSGSSNLVMTSPDGIAWTLGTPFVGGYWSSVTYGNALFVTVGNSGGGAVMTSPDGITWTSRASQAAAANYTWNGITYGNGLFVAVSFSGNQVMTSPDGITWTSQLLAANNNWNSVTYGNGLFVAVGNSASGIGAVTTSPAFDAPTISAVNPAYGGTAGGTKVTLTGTSFTGTTAVSLGGAAATQVNVVSDTSLTATTPAHATGVASVVVTTPAGANAANSLFSYTDCGPGVPLTTGTGGVGALWQMLALPCVPATGTIAGVFGTGTPSNLSTANYASAGIGWIIENRTVGAVPAYQPLLSSNLPLTVGAGYWLKSYQAPMNGTLTMNGAATPTDTTQAQGCYSANGCKAITVTTVTGNNRYNLVGNPFPYAIDWTKVRIRVDGSSSTLTPSAANTAGYIDNTVNIWNGTGYDTFTDVAPYPSTPNLQYFKSFWINVLPGAFGHTIELLIPAEQSTLSRNHAAPTSFEALASVNMPWYLGWLDWVVSPATAASVPAVSNNVNPQPLPDPSDWYIRLKVDNPVTGWKDHGALLGQLTDAALGFDKHDVVKMAPFTAPYLTLVFPHPDWGVKAADYASDFHLVTNTVDSWRFEVRASPVGSIVFLSWEGDPALLSRSQLLEVATGKVINPTDPAWTAKGYPVTLNAPAQSYVWTVLAH